MKRGNSHIEEWIRQTSKDAVPPDMLGDNERNIYSPTLTDKSLSYTQTVSGIIIAGADLGVGSRGGVQGVGTFLLF